MANGSLEYYELFPENDLQPGNRLVINVDDLEILLLNINGEYFAVENCCTHEDEKLDPGELEGYQIACPRHGSRFDVRTGAALTLPAYKPVHTFPVKVENGRVFLGIPELD
ncbi:MAG TPA: non-heme iron oxygenase ferredoxin subunit [Bellilinea sp.]|nr:non-heme iron oxygenase ferredoxin subunit [Bellilinea sp.]